MNKKARVMITFLAAIICVGVNIFWLFHRGMNPRPMIRVNIITGGFLMIMVATVLYQRK